MVKNKILSLFLLLSHYPLDSLSFIPNAPSYQMLKKKSSLNMSSLSPDRISADRIQKVGCGIPLDPSGVLEPFDPEKEGKLQGTGSLDDRIKNGSSYTYTQSKAAAEPQSVNPVPADVHIVEAQHWLEDLGVPVNFAKPQNPVKATVLGRARIISDDAPGDIQHIVLRLPENMHYVEGQSLSVIPPGTDPNTGRTYKPRLYSIASTRYGDILDGNTVSLCVRRAEFYDPITTLPVPAKKGVCSNFLCDSERGDEVMVAGPVGKTMLLPEDPTADVIMIATGTGIAPFRAFLHRLFMENTVTGNMFQGTAWLVLGVPTTGGLLYPEEIIAMKQNAAARGAPDSLKVDYAISREMKNQNGGKMYVQNVIEENADEFFDRLNNGANCYFCGLKGMMPPILETLEEVAAKKGVDWPEMLKRLKDNHQWHVEVY